MTTRRKQELKSYLLIIKIKVCFDSKQGGVFIKVDNLYVDKEGCIKSMDSDAEPIIDLLYDIGAGICNTQKIAESNKENSRFDISKVKEYQSKTKIPQMIQDALIRSEYWKDYEWCHEKEFVVDGSHYKVIRYDINTSDWCLIERDGKEIRISKRHLKKLWKEREL